MSQRFEVLRVVGIAVVGFTVGCGLSGCGSRSASAGVQVPVSITYPKVERGDQVDDYHGTRVADPYRWLEDIDSPRTAQFVAAENAVSRPYLDVLPGRERIKALLTKLWNYE